MAKYKMTKSTGVGKVAKKKGGKRKKRGVGAVGSGWMPVIEFAVGVGLGVIAGREGATLIGSMIPSAMANPMLVGVGEAAGGVLLAKEAKAPFVKGIGYGIAGNGLTTVVVSTGIISGPNNMVYRLNGVKKPMGNIKFVAGPQTRIGTLGNSNLAMVAGNGRKNSMVG
jgi:hypothetical protein